MSERTVKEIQVNFMRRWNVHTFADQSDVERCIQEIVLGNNYWVCTYGFYSDSSKKNT